MRFFFLFLSCLFLTCFSFAQPPQTGRQPRILILLDGSSSMTYDWGSGLNRFQAAGEVVQALMDSVYAVNGAVEFGLRVYGQQYPAQDNNCYDTRREVTFSKDNQTQMALRLASITPRGVSPIAFSLEQAALLDLEDEARNAYAIILISDGGESCGGDICKIADLLLKRKIFFRPYIISLVDYAPLKAEYSCLGTYMQVAKAGDIGPAISSIVNDYRPLLKDPSVKTAPPTVSKPAAPKPIATAPKPATTPNSPPAKPIPPFQPAQALQAAGYNRMPVIWITRAKLARQPLVRVKWTPEPAPVVVKKDTVAAPPPAPKPETTSVKIVPVAPAATKPQPVAQPKPEAPKTMEVQVDREDAANTLVAVYFTDGRGKFYQSTPKMQFVDKNGKTVKQFYRTIDANGNPDPQELVAGSYKLVISNKKSSTTREVEVQPGKLNKLMLVVNKGSLKFSYLGAAGRPVSEFNAIVNRRFAPGPVVHQKATEELEYEPGNYYIELNTLPISRRNVDIDFGAVTEIHIKQPGFVQVANTDPVGDIHLYYPLGDRYVKFYTLAGNGNPESQKVMLQPGVYEAHWKPNPNMPYAKEKVVPFEVKSNSLTQIELR